MKRQGRATTASPTPSGQRRRHHRARQSHRRADRVDDEQRAVQPVPGAGHAGGDSEHGRKQEQDAIDDPVAP